LYKSIFTTAGAYHDIAREGEGTDYWDEESSEALETLLSTLGIEEREEYVRAIKEKDPKNGNFSSDVQRILHDADSLDIMRVIGRFSFSKNHLCFYAFDPQQRSFCDQLINEIADFISITEKPKIRNELEHFSNDFYGDLVRLLFSEKNNKGTTRFPLITQLLQNDMQKILTP